MNNPAYSTIFGIGITSANVRLSNLNLAYLQRLMSEAFALGFNISSTQGDVVYNTYKNNNGDSTLGFDSNSIYNSYEEIILSVIETFDVGDSSLNQKVLAIASNAMIFGYSLNQSINPNDFISLLSQVLYRVADKVNGNQIFQLDSNGNVIQPFTSQYILNFLNNNSYQLVLQQINQTPKTTNTSLANYNWYDAYPLFPSPNLQLMKDIENQYYYISGSLIYQNTNLLSNCIEDTILINTNTGVITGTYIRNSPCFESSNYIGPPSSLNFLRIFNDGPSSSGHFSQQIQNEYINWDKAVLNPLDYSCNAILLNSFIKNNTGQYAPLCLQPVFIDDNGVYAISGTEYQYTPDLYDCDTYQRMHIGDNLPRTICSKTCSCTLENVTGFKFASLSLPQNYANNYAYILSNPQDTGNRVLLRALNLNSNPYLASVSGVGLATYTNPITPTWYFGPPQLSGGNQLPELAFFQKFNSPTFGDLAEIVVYASIGTSNGNTNGESQRTYNISTNYLISGITVGTTIQFNQPFNSSGLPDNITKSLFGMGDNFGNNYTTQTLLQNNAGFIYTGYLLFDNMNNLVNSINITGNYSNSILGSPYSSIQYISGYSGNGFNIGMSQNFAQDNSGNLYPYYYINSNSSPVPNQYTGWNYFAQLPTGLENTGGRLYTTQGVENYLPRFSGGPYCIQREKFLYPNALLASQFYTSKINGFPISVNYEIEVREEALGEIFGYYNINNRGIVDSSPTLTNTVNVANNGSYSGNVNSPNIFSNASNSVNFNLWPVADEIDKQITISNYVDNNYAPSDTYGNPILGKNNQSSIGNYSVFTNNGFNIFNNGLRLTGVGSQLSKIFNSNGSYNVYTEAPCNSAIYHGYRGALLSGNLLYVPPIFDLNTQSLKVSNNLQTTITYNNLNQGLPFDRYGSGTGIINTGEDPLFYNLIGGRTGDYLASSQGGYNPNGIIGDGWLNATGITYGISYASCEGGRFYFRNPGQDDTILLFNSTPFQTTLWTKGMRFSPYSITRNKYIPFGQGDSVSYSFNNGNINTLNTTLSGERLVFDLMNFFPLIPTGNSYNFWYNQSGLTIGPFDRDVELGITYPDSLTAFTDLYINGKHITDLYRTSTDCLSADLVRGIATAPNIIPNGEWRTLPYAILDTMKKGESLNINIYSNPTIGGGGLLNLPAGYAAETMIGIPSGAKVSIKAFKPLDGVPYDQFINSGEDGYLDTSNTVSNDFVNNWVINTPNGFMDLNNKTFEFIVNSKSGIIYPIPGDDFVNMGTTDSFGNLSYPSNATVQEYWIRYCRANNTSIKLSGYREGSRVSFTFRNVQINYGALPYHTYNVIIPNGTCNLSGTFGYYSEADNAIYSAGVVLTDNTPNDPTLPLFDPIYISQVLNRVSGINNITGNGNQPILYAPSMMIQKFGNNFVNLNTMPPYNYNKFNWPALSDLEYLNRGETLESLPLDDGNTFLGSSILFSACQGQQLPNGRSNPNVNKVYLVSGAYQLYDSTATNSLWNTGTCITQNRGTVISLSQNNMSGIDSVAGSSITLATVGLS